MHYALYGRGQQTWEYAPAHALRSWAYVLAQGALAWAAGGGAGADKIAVFHRLHALLAAASAGAEMVLVAGLAAVEKLRAENNQVALKKFNVLLDEA